MRGDAANVIGINYLIFGNRYEYLLYRLRGSHSGYPKWGGVESTLHRRHVWLKTFICCQRSKRVRVRPFSPAISLPIYRLSAVLHQPRGAWESSVPGVATRPRQERRPPLIVASLPSRAAECRADSSDVGTQFRGRSLSQPSGE